MFQGLFKAEFQGVYNIYLVCFTCHLQKLPFQSGFGTKC